MHYCMLLLLAAASLACLFTVQAQELAPTHDYVKALQYSHFFYRLQRMGPAPVDVNWRGGCALDDDVNGAYAYMDAGDNVFFGLPFGSTFSVLSYSAVAFRNGYVLSGQMQALQEELKFASDFVLAGWNPATQTFPVQIGSGREDHTKWITCEFVNLVFGQRQIYYASPSCLATDIASDYSTFLSIASLVFEENGGASASYIAQMRAAAKGLFEYAEQNGAFDNQGKFAGCGGADNAQFYPSNGPVDSFGIAAYWLWKSTGERQSTALDQRQMFRYLSRSYDYLAHDQAPSWDAHALIMAPYIYADSLSFIGDPAFTGIAPGENGNAELPSSFVAYQIERKMHWNLENWMTRASEAPGAGREYGLPGFNQWGNRRYTSNAAVAALFWSEVAPNTGDEQQAYASYYQGSQYASEHGAFPTTAAKRASFRTWAKDLIDSVFGSNPEQRSYVYGIGAEPYPVNPHHRTASAAYHDYVTSEPFPNRHKLYGALVGGPFINDPYNDIRSEYRQSEVAIDYNSGYQAMLAAVIERLPLANQVPPTMGVPEEPVGEEFFQDLLINGDQYRIRFHQRTAWPARLVDQLEVRIYFDFADVYACGHSADQVSIERNFVDRASYDGTPIAVPTYVDPITNEVREHVYYVRYFWPNNEDQPYTGRPSDTNEEELQAKPQLNSGLECASWDRTKDPSRAGGKSIPVYSNGNLIWGYEPSGADVPPVPAAPPTSPPNPPVPTAPPTAPPNPPNPNAPPQCGTLDCQLKDDWDSGFKYECTVSPWTTGTHVGWTWNDASISFSGPWNAAIVTQANQQVVVELQNGSAQGFGFVGSKQNGVTPVMSDFSIDGQSCSGGGNPPNPTAPPTPVPTPKPTAPPKPTPVPTPKPTVLPTPTAPAPTGGGACDSSYSFTIGNSWNGGGQVSLKVPGVSTVSWNTNGAYSIANLWGGSYTTSGNVVTVTLYGWNTAGNVGFNVNGNVQVATSLKIDGGDPCTL